MSRFLRCNCPAGVAAPGERHAPDCPSFTGMTAPMAAMLAVSARHPKPAPEFQAGPAPVVTAAFVPGSLADLLFQLGEQGVQVFGGTDGAHWSVAVPIWPRSSPVELVGVSEVLAEGHGFWRTCSGCHETEDGHPVGSYAYSSVLQCSLGSGCSECGGLGATWDNTDYDEVVRLMLDDDQTLEGGADD
ncbi:hypothetical protein [Ectopseudomonas toyotomiensis]|uniref:hypothetical protein n=1 Tax=Ectopseudomonas toyotomiensis TaxID=554344 RepID=UPI003D0BDE1B